MRNEIHSLEVEYGLTKTELLDALNRRFRARVTLEGVVAEVHLGKQIRALREKGVIARFQEHDQDGYPDYSIWLPSTLEKALRIECKNVRDAEEAYRRDGKVVAFKVETQKTRASKSDRSSRYYGYDQFEILAVCLGKKTHNWRQFMCIQSKDLTQHAEYENKLAVMHAVPVSAVDAEPPWYPSLEALLEALHYG